MMIIDKGIYHDFPFVMFSAKQIVPEINYTILKGKLD